MADKIIAVIDGKGGGLGKAIVQKIAAMNLANTQIIALGTNSHATTAMLAAGASNGASGENAICHMCGKVDIIVGPLAIMVANSMMGEISEKMAAAIASCNAKKLLLPMERCGVWVVGVRSLSLRDILDELPGELLQLLA